MKIKNLTPIALFVGCQACVIQIIDQLMCGVLPPAGNVGFSCISFLGWATYFFAGCTVRDGVRAFFDFLIGMAASIIIMLMGGQLGALGFFATPAAVLVIAWLLFYLDIAPVWISLLPAVYISAGAYFVLMSYVPGATFGNIFFTETVYLTLGLIFGWMTITFRQWYESRGKKSEE